MSYLEVENRFSQKISYTYMSFRNIETDLTETFNTAKFRAGREKFRFKKHVHVL